MLRRTKLLSMAHSATRHRVFAPLHQLVRRIYAGPFLAVFSRILAARSGIAGLRIEPRHSAASGAGFNVFSSDLDCVAVIPPEASDAGDARLRRAVEIYARSRVALPFLGELELYSREEWAAKRELDAKGARLFKIILEIRRVVWQEQALAKAPTPYHRRKALLAIAKRLGEIDPTMRPRAGWAGNLIQVAPAIERELVALGDVGLEGLPEELPEIEAFSRYLGCHLGTRVTGKPSEIVLSRATIARFLAILPDGKIIGHQHAELLDRLRQSPKLRSIWLAVMTHEMLLVRSGVRACGAADDATALWLAELEAGVGVTRSFRTG